MPHRRHPIFVLDIGDGVTFAFEAEHLAQAERFADAPWFTRAILEYRASRRGAWDHGAARRIRAATEHQAALYRDYADEFADIADQFLIARLYETA